jgi:hypothetical protein
MEWSHDVLRGYDYNARQLLVLLERVGAEKEAAFIRERIDRDVKQSTEDLRKAALDGNNAAQARLAAAQRLFDRGEADAIEAFETLLDDPGASSYERFSVVPFLLDMPARRDRCIATLQRIAQDEPWNRVACGRALMFGGEALASCDLLRVTAFEPGESPKDRTKAIELLAQSGRLDLAASAFRRLNQSACLTDSCLKTIAEAFAHTPVWEEFLGICRDILSSASVSLRLEALAILMRSPWVKTNKRGASNLLRKVITNRSASPSDRIDAAGLLSDLDREYAIDLVYDIAIEPEETFEAGLAALQFL